MRPQSFIAWYVANGRFLEGPQSCAVRPSSAPLLGVNSSQATSTTVFARHVLSRHSLYCEFFSLFCPSLRQILELLKHAHASGIPFDGPEDGVDTPQLRSLLRRAAASATVLLKNDRSLLPLSNSIKSIAVIGPNAKQAFTSGGGSARLLETYSVSPLEGIRVAAKEIGAEVRYTVGATSHKYLPVLDGYMKYEGGNGALVEFWNHEPVDGWVNQLKDGEKCVWSTPTRGSNCFLMDGIVRCLSFNLVQYG